MHAINISSDDGRPWASRAARFYSSNSATLVRMLVGPKCVEGAARRVGFTCETGETDTASDTSSDPNWEKEYKGYAHSFIKETLTADAYFTGYIAAKTLQHEEILDRCELLQLRCTVFALLFAIGCQFFLISWMGIIGFGYSIPDLLKPETFHPIVNRGLLSVGIFAFIMQCLGEDYKVQVYDTALYYVDYSESSFEMVSIFKMAKKVVPLLLQASGLLVLIRSKGNLEIILNCTALAFVFELDDLTLAAICPRLTESMYLRREEFFAGLAENADNVIATGSFAGGHRALHAPLLIVFVFVLSIVIP